MRIILHISAFLALVLGIALFPLLGEGERARASTPEEEAAQDRLDEFFKEAEKRGYITMREDGAAEEEGDTETSPEAEALPVGAPDFEAHGPPEVLTPNLQGQELTEELQIEDILAQEAGHASAPSAPQEMITETVPCEAVSGFDMANLSDSVSYSDSYSIRETLLNEDGSTNQDKLVELSRIYLSLGLGTEAIAASSRGTSAQARLAHQMALTLSQDSERQPSFFAALGACNPQAGMWQALALINIDDARAAQKFKTHLEAVNALPLPIKKQVVGLVVDLLLRQSDTDLAASYLGLLDDEIIETDSHLILQRALLGAETGDEASASVLKELSESPGSTRYKAMMAIDGSGRDAAETRDLFDQIALTNSPYEAYELGRIVVDDYLHQGAITQAIYVSRMDEFSEAPIRTKLVRKIVDSVKSDINGASPLRQMAALAALENEHDFFLATKEPQEIFALGVKKSLDVGFYELAEALALYVSPQEMSPRLLARLLFHREGEVKALYDLALGLPEDLLISELALRQAIEYGKGDIVARLSRQLPPTESKLLDMARHAYSHGQWSVAEGFLSEALITNMEEGPRLLLSDVQFMQIGKIKKPLKSYKPKDVSAALAQSKAQLVNMNGRLRDG
jgi:hypothetical protein